MIVIWIQLIVVAAAFVLLIAALYKTFEITRQAKLKLHTFSGHERRQIREWRLMLILMTFITCCFATALTDRIIKGLSYVNNSQAVYFSFAYAAKFLIGKLAFRITRRNHFLKI